MKRPSPYVPLSVTFATGRTGSAILERFGLEGLSVWVCMIATAGIANSGQIVFRHEDDWAVLGLAAHPPDFTLREFLKFLGTRKQTRTTSHGRVMYVQLTQWERWNNIKQREQARQRSSRYRGKSERDDAVTDESLNRHPDTDTEPETETEQKKTLAPDKPTPKPRPRDELWDALTEVIGHEPTTTSERGRRNKALKELRAIEATPQQIIDHADHFRQTWPNLTLTETALVAHWARFTNGPERIPAPKRYGRGVTAEEAFAQAGIHYSTKELDR